MDPASQAAQIASARAAVWLGMLPPHQPVDTSLAVTHTHRDAPEALFTGAPRRSWRRHAEPGLDRPAEVVGRPRTGPLLVGLWSRTVVRRLRTRSASSVAGARP